MSINGQESTSPNAARYLFPAYEPDMGSRSIAGRICPLGSQEILSYLTNAG